MRGGTCGLLLLLLLLLRRRRRRLELLKPMPPPLLLLLLLLLLLPLLSRHGCHVAGAPLLQGLHEGAVALGLVECPRPEVPLVPPTPHPPPALLPALLGGQGGRLAAPPPLVQAPPVVLQCRAGAGVQRGGGQRMPVQGAGWAGGRRGSRAAGGEARVHHGWRWMTHKKTGGGAGGIAAGPLCCRCVQAAISRSISTQPSLTVGRLLLERKLGRWCVTHATNTPSVAAPHLVVVHEQHISSRAAPLAARAPPLAHAQAARRSHSTPPSIQP